MKRYILLLVFTIAGGNGLAQQLNIDSLRHQLTVAKHDTNRVQLLWSLSFAFDAVSHDSAQQYANKSLALGQKIQYSRGEARALERRAQAYWISGDFPKALTESFNGLQLAQELDFYGQVVRCLNNIGNVYLDLKDYAKAVTYFKQAQKLANEKEKGAFSSNLEANLALAYQRKGQLDSAWYFMQQSIQHHKGADKVGLYSHFIYIGMGTIQFGRRNYDDAFASLRKSISINKDANDNRLLSASYNELAKFFRKLNQPDSAVYYAKVALSNAQLVGAKRYALESSMLLAELLEAGNSRESLFYYKVAKSVNEELYGAEKVLSLQRIIADEQERQRVIDVERVAYQNQLKQYSLFAGLGVLLLIAFILYRTNKQQKKANHLLHQQKEEIDHQRSKAEQALSELKSTQTQLIQREKMASLGELTAGIAHEIQNP